MVQSRHHESEIAMKGAGYATMKLGRRANQRCPIRWAAGAQSDGTWICRGISPAATN